MLYVIGLAAGASSARANVGMALAAKPAARTSAVFFIWYLRKVGTRWVGSVLLLEPLTQVPCHAVAWRGMAKLSSCACAKVARRSEEGLPLAIPCGSQRGPAAEDRAAY